MNEEGTHHIGEMISGMRILTDSCIYDIREGSRKRILHLVPLKDIIVKSFGNRFKLDILRLFGPPIAN